MMVYISLLRGVNVGGRKMLMAELKELYESLKFRQVTSYIQSGNIIFKSSNQKVEELEKEIEGELYENYDFQVPIFIRKVNEFKKIIEDNPFSKEDLTKVYITFLKRKPENLSVNLIDDRKDESEKFQIREREIYLFLPQGYGRTKISNNFFENRFKLKATTRNWRTVNRLYKLAKDL
jgi:uncharacterized protein (DUF1697 family)